jgi:hypothetical protein
MIGLNDLITLAIHPLPQHRRTFERDHSAWCQGQILSGCRVPAPPGSLVSDGEFGKAADENVVATGEGCLDKFEDGFKETRGFESGKAKATLKGTYDVVFGESHGRQLLKVGGYQQEKPMPFT